MNRLIATVAAGTLTVGLLVGAAGATLVANASQPDAYDHISQMSQMHASMGGTMGSGMMGSGMMGGHFGSGMMGPRDSQGSQP